MKTYYTYLGSMFIALIISTMVNAQELNVNTSGFITATTFSDKDWYPNTDAIALNLDVTYGEFAVRGQIAAPAIRPVRRLVAEYSLPIVDNSDLTIQIGEFPRLVSIYNAINDSPASYGMAILPLGLYNRRMVDNQTFTTLYGINLVERTRINDGTLEVHVDYGKLRVEDECQTQEEQSREPCVSSWKIYGKNGNYDYGFTYSVDKSTFLLYRSVLVGGTTLIDPKNPMAVLIATVDDSVEYINDSAGFSHSFDNGFYFQTEILHNVFYRAAAGQKFQRNETSVTGYLLGGYCWNDFVCSYVEHNKGKTSDSFHMQDNVIGTTVTWDSFVTSLEYHDGHGIIWANYNSPHADWKSIVLSVTYKF